MKEWEYKINAGPKFGICTVREHTDQEVSVANAAGINYAHCDGFVNLFRDDVFVGFCGRAWAEGRIIEKPKIIHSVKAS